MNVFNTISSSVDPDASDHLQQIQSESPLNQFFHVSTGNPAQPSGWDQP